MTDGITNDVTRFKGSPPKFLPRVPNLLGQALDIG